jgi:2-keto-4-pentenoate hydratase/2-oxohepta-3-ene-1,7-dioic acid hydratase in catechol pathway
MIFDIPTLIETISRGITLYPGDVIATGTPAGVGFARKPPVFLKPGDVMEVDIERIGGLGNPIVAAEALVGA